MLRLDATTRKLQAVLAGAITTNQLPCTVSYSDKTSTDYVGGTQLTNTNSTTQVDICAAPAASTIRDIDYVSVKNIDTASATVSIILDDNATDYTIAKFTLAVGDQLTYTHGTGWQVIASDGTLKTGSGISFPLSVAQGGTGSTTASAARAALSAWGGAYSDIASAATLDLSAVQGIVRITGTTATSAVTLNNGQYVICYAVGAWPLTYHATNNPVQGGADRTCEAGDLVVYAKDNNGTISNQIVPKSGYPDAGYKNKVIGGDFSTNPWQRGTTFTAPASGAYCADRFYVTYSTDGAVDVKKTADAPTAAQAGMYSQHCLHIDVTTADAAMAAGQYYAVNHLIEGLNVIIFGFGQAGTRYVTLSFWHCHTKTGTYCVGLANNAANRSYVAEYTQAVSDTWEKAVITIPVDTSGTWLYDNGIGLRVTWAVACGSTYGSATANTWSGSYYFATANQVNALDSASNNFKLDFVQLEAGQVATKFEALSVPEVNALCYRYYYRETPGVNTYFRGSSWSGSTTVIYNRTPFPVVMRIAPTALEQDGTAAHYSYTQGGTGFACSAVPTFTSASQYAALSTFTVASGLTAGYAGGVYSSNSAAYLGWSAEL